MRARLPVEMAANTGTFPRISSMFGALIPMEAYRAPQRRGYLFSLAVSAAALSSAFTCSRSSLAFCACPPRSYSLAFCAATHLSYAWATSFCAAARLGCFLALTFTAGRPFASAVAVEVRRAVPSRAEISNRFIGCYLRCNLGTPTVPRMGQGVPARNTEENQPKSSLGRPRPAPVSRAAACLFLELHVHDPHAAVHRFQHVVHGQRRDAHGRERLHLHAGAVDRPHRGAYRHAG